MSKNFRFLLIVNFYIAAILLLLAGVLKLSNDEVNPILTLLFEDDLLSVSQLQFISKYLPIFEIALGILMISGILYRFSAILSVIVYTIFTGGIIYASRGYLLLPIDCGCFSTGTTTPVILLLIRNIGILTLLLFLGLKKREDQSSNLFG